MESNVHKAKTHKMDKQALRFYGIMSTVIYLSALVYCYDTNHFFEVGLLGVVMLALGALVMWVYKQD